MLCLRPLALHTVSMPPVPMHMPALPRVCVEGVCEATGLHMHAKSNLSKGCRGRTRVGVDKGRAKGEGMGVGVGKKVPSGSRLRDRGGKGEVNMRGRGRGREVRLSADTLVEK
ncbi:hypothetical protein DFH94DRAFT_683157 [Russula ochroleuca]|uniref:Uncharacterized protein n=1 Tax=Russula ochroleuca TaxID=152965 RepID=A0A9P5MT34_9AGAM|nr:hypothetical protein DFH94DRAFT_683157 [Russula ochroleuca]